jgi:diguanylate cyclase (GGDEF)-like protein/PAS domain S-box-containing protein
MVAVETELVDTDTNCGIARFLGGLRHASQGFSISDGAGNLIDCNSSWHKVLGYEDAICAMGLADDLWWNCDDDVEFGRAIAGLNADSAATIEFDVRPRPPGDSERLVRVAACRLDVGKGGPWFLWQISNRSKEEHYRSRALQLEQVMEQTCDAIIALDLNGNVIFWNREANNVFDVPAAQAVGQSLRKVRAGDISDAEFETILARIKAGKPTSSTFERCRKDGRTINVAVKTVPLLDHEGWLIGEITVGRDVTDMKHAEDALRTAHATLEARVRAIREANRNLSREVGVRRKTEGALRNSNIVLESTVKRLESYHRDDEILSRMSELLQSSVQRNEAYTVIRETGESLFPGGRGELYIYRDSRDALEQVTAWGASNVTQGLLVPDDCWALRLGRPHHVHLNGSIRCRHAPADRRFYACLPVQGQGQVLGMLHLEVNMGGTITHEFRDEMERRMRAVVDNIGPALANLKLRDSLRSLSLRDALTGLYNRRYMDDTLQRELLRATRAGNPLCLMMIDIDHFKRFNDTFGHAAGDYALSSVAQLIPKNLRASDLSCRYGGEEFLVVMPDATLATAVERAEMLREALRTLGLTHNSRTMPAPTISIGIAEYPSHGGSAAHLLKSADNALYRAKHLGRDQVCISQDALPTS